MNEEISDLINKLCSYKKYNQGKYLLHSTVITMSKKIVTDSIKANVELQAKTGLQPKVVRSSSGKCCSWCDNLAGVYKYPDIPDNVYRRHRGCNCVVTYDPGDGRIQNVHSKKWYEEESERVKARYEKNQKRVAKQPNDSIMYSGARILDPDNENGQKHAELFYQEVKSYSTDCAKIASNTGYSIEDIKKIKEYLFNTPEFTPDCAIAQSWQRLMIGKDIKKHDLTLLKHELYEMELKEKYKGIGYYEVHKMAKVKYDYGKEVREYYDSLKKYKQDR